MGLITKDKIIFRGDNEELMAVVVDLELLPKGEDGEYQQIKCVPLTKGQMNELLVATKEGETTLTQDQVMLTKYCIEPKFVAEEVENMPQVYKTALVYAMMSLSTGIPQETIKERTLNKTLEGIEKN